MPKREFEAFFSADAQAGRLARNSLLAALIFAALGCGVPASSAKPSATITIDACGHAPLPIVDSGENAPEALIRIYRALPVYDGAERVYAFGGPCRSSAGARFSLRVKTRAPLNVGALYFTVPQGTFGSNGFVPRGPGWALRLATAAEMRKYEACSWSA